MSTAVKKYIYQSMQWPINTIFSFQINSKCSPYSIPPQFPTDRELQVCDTRTQSSGHLHQQLPLCYCCSYFSFIFLQQSEQFAAARNTQLGNLETSLCALIPMCSYHGHREKNILHIHTLTKESSHEGTRVPADELIIRVHSLGESDREISSRPF